VTAAAVRLVLVHALEPDRAVVPVVDHQDAARRHQCDRRRRLERGDARDARRGQQRAGRAVVAALAADPQAVACGVVVDGLGHLARVIG